MVLKVLKDRIGRKIEGLQLGVTRAERLRDALTKIRARTFAEEGID